MSVVSVEFSTIAYQLPQMIPVRFAHKFGKLSVGAKTGDSI